MNGYIKILLLKVFTQRNFVAIFISQKLSFSHKHSKYAFSTTHWGLGGNIHASSTVLAHDRLQLLQLKH